MCVFQPKHCLHKTVHKGDLVGCQIDPNFACFKTKNIKNYGFIIFLHDKMAVSSSYCQELTNIGIRVSNGIRIAVLKQK